MTLLDAYALIAFLTGGPAAAQVHGILREGDVAVTTINLAEALEVSERRRGLPIHRAMEILGPLLTGPIVSRPLDIPVARRAAELRAMHYKRASREISLADTVLIASATAGDRIATSDPDVLAVAATEQIATLPLPEQG